MKKLFFVLLCLFCAYGINAQTTAKGPSKEDNLLNKAYSYTIDPTNYAKPKLKFKHSAGPSYCSNCMCPLGICIQIPFFSEELTSLQIEDGYGTASISIIDAGLLLVFDHAAALPDGTITIDSNFAIGSEYSGVLGFTSVTITAGTYTVTNITDQNPYGQCIFAYTAY